MAMTHPSEPDAVIASIARMYGPMATEEQPPEMRPVRVLPSQIWQDADPRGSTSFRVVAVYGDKGYAECRGGRGGTGNLTRVRLDRLIRPKPTLKPFYHFLDGPLGD